MTDTLSPVPHVQDRRRAAWLAARRQVITGTDAAKVLGLSKFGGPMDVYLDKLGLSEEKESTEAMLSGRRLERPIIEWYADDQNVSITFEEPYTLIRSPELSRIGATLDARRHDRDGSFIASSPVDAKNIRFQTADWGEAGTDQMPLYYAAQLVLQMHVTGANFADLAVLFSGQDLRFYRLHRDAETHADILGTCQRFYEEHVLTETPPPVDGSQAYADYLKRLVRQATEEVKPATNEIDLQAIVLQEAKLELSRAEGKKLHAENIIKDFIGESAKAAGANWSASWTTSKDTVGTNWEAVAREMALIIANERGAGVDEVLGTHAQEHQIITRKGGRTFRFTYKGDK